MIVSPEKVARDLAAEVKRVVADVARMLPAGEKIIMRIRFGDCVPFDVEIEGKEKAPASDRG